MAVDSFNVLVIKHLPHQLTKEEKVSFLKECGAIEVDVIDSKINKYSLAFAKYSSSDHAKKALEHLHQRPILGSYLVCEYARGKKIGTVLEDPISESKLKQLKETKTATLIKDFYDKLNYWTTDTNLRIPVPSHLRYSYPPPTPKTLYNISYMLETCPKFYTQVLHLMNKMNLPCPIETELSASYPSVHTVVGNATSMQKSESESELSSGEDVQRETVPDLKRVVKKTIKRPKIIKPNVLPKSVKKIKLDEVFEDPKTLDTPSKPKLKPIVKEAIVERDKEVSGFGFIEPINPPAQPEETDPIDVRNVMEEERLEKTPINHISLKDLASNRISEKDRNVLPVFNNYAEGAPSLRLYVKNLAKQTTDQDLRFIFSAFLTDELPINMFDIRLMQEGRMKGQAFITFQTVQLAQKALSETNGYILNNKPMVVQFARVSATKIQNDKTQDKRANN